MPKEPYYEKYRTKAAKFYRDQLKSKVEGTKFLQNPPTLQQGIEIDIVQIPQQVLIIQPLTYEASAPPLEEENQTVGNFFGNWIKKGWQKTVDTYQGAKSRATDNQNWQKVKLSANSAYETAKDTSTKMLDKTKILAEQAYDKTKALANESKLQTAKDFSSAALKSSLEKGKYGLNKLLQFTGLKRDQQQELGIKEEKDPDPYEDQKQEEQQEIMVPLKDQKL